MAEPVLFRDGQDIQPPADMYEKKLEENIYTTLAPPKFIACAEDIWLPTEEDASQDNKVEVKTKSAAELRSERMKKTVSDMLEHYASLILVFITIPICAAGEGGSLAAQAHSLIELAVECQRARKH